MRTLYTNNRFIEKLVDTKLIKYPYNKNGDLNYNHIKRL